MGRVGTWFTGGKSCRLGSEETQVAEWDIDREEKAPNKGHSISQITYHSGRLMHHSAGIFCELVQNMCFIVLLAEG